MDARNAKPHKFFIMRWVISTDEFNKLSPAEKKFFAKKIKTTAPKLKINEWVSYGDLPKMTKRARRKYEIFCGGFLYFYDNDFIAYLKEVNGKTKGAGNKFLAYFKNKSFDHDISFVWEPDKSKPGRVRVTVYLNPPAGNPDPPRPPAPPPPESST